MLYVYIYRQIEFLCTYANKVVYDFSLSVCDSIRALLYQVVFSFVLIVLIFSFSGFPSFPALITVTSAIFY